MQKKIFVICGALIVALASLVVVRLDFDAKRVIKIGAALNITGPASEYGKCGLDALEVIKYKLSTECLNEDVRFEFIVEDTGSTPKGTINAYRAIKMKAPDCKVVLTQGSAMGAAITDFTRQDKVVQFSAGAFSDPIANNPYFFVNISDQKVVADMFLNEMPKYKSGIVYFINDDFGISVCKLLTAALGEKLTCVPFQQDSNVRDLIVKSTWTNADVVLLIGWGPSMLNLIRGLRESGYKRNILSTAELKSVANKKALADLSNGIYCMSYASPPEDVQMLYMKLLNKSDLYISDINIFNASLLAVHAIRRNLREGNNDFSAMDIVRQFNVSDVLNNVPCLVGVKDQRLLYRMEFEPL